MLTQIDVITSSGKYPERANSSELTLEVRDNIDKLLLKVNAFLHDLQIPIPKVSSGFRPSSVNSKTPGAAPHSQHMIGCAVDLEDVGDKLEDIVTSRDPLLKKYGLWQESPIYTAGWVHLDMLDRGLRPRNRFIP